MRFLLLVMMRGERGRVQGEVQVLLSLLSCSLLGREAGASDDRVGLDAEKEVHHL